MEAIEFLKQYDRMCEYYTGCSDCPIKKFCFDTEPEEFVSKVEQWSQTHPQKTMMQDFFEKFPKAPKEEDGTPIDICPSYCGYTDEPNSLNVCEKFN